LEQLRGSSYAKILAIAPGYNSGDENGSVESTSVIPTLLEVEWAEMVKGVEEEKRTQGDVAALDMFRGKQIAF
jgi:hypothetical protein